jgi:catabolite regulation protein CreA
MLNVPSDDSDCSVSNRIYFPFAFDEKKMRKNRNEVEEKKIKA